METTIETGARETEVKEGEVARGIERITARWPSDLFLWGSVCSVAISLGLMLSGRKQAANFVGQWAPTVLLLGLYNKIVKVAGHERYQGEVH